MRPRLAPVSLLFPVTLTTPRQKEFQLFVKGLRAVTKVLLGRDATWREKKGLNKFVFGFILVRSEFWYWFTAGPRSERCLLS